MTEHKIGKYHKVAIEPKDGWYRVIFSEQLDGTWYPLCTEIWASLDDILEEYGLKEAER